MRTGQKYEGETVYYRRIKKIKKLKKKHRRAEQKAVYGETE